jgi:hypothetical protein
MSALQEKSNNHLDDDSSTTPAKPMPTASGFDIPDGGLTAWLQVIGAFFLMFNSWCIQGCLPLRQ